MLLTQTISDYVYTINNLFYTQCTVKAQESAAVTLIDTYVLLTCINALPMYNICSYMY